MGPDAEREAAEYEAARELRSGVKQQQRRIQLPADESHQGGSMTIALPLADLKVDYLTTVASQLQAAASNRHFQPPAEAATAVSHARSDAGGLAASSPMPFLRPHPPGTEVGAKGFRRPSALGVREGVYGRGLQEG